MKEELAIKKYNAINRANRTMFIFVAIASVIVGAAVVGIIFLSQKIAFKGKVIGEQTKTLAAIDRSSSNVDELIKKVKLLRSNEALSSVKKIDGANNLQVVVDALPKVGNTAAIGSSLSDEILSVAGLTVESINIDPTSSNVSSASSSTGGISTSSNALSSSVKTVGFSISVSAKSGAERKAADIIQEFLKRMEKSIRTFSVSNITLEMNSENQINVNITGQAFYLPDNSIKLEDKVIKSNQNNTKSNTSSKNSSSTGGKK